MASDKVVVNLTENGIPVWETDLTPSNCDPPLQLSSISNRGPRPRIIPYPGVVSTTVDDPETSRHVSGASSPATYPNSHPDYSDVSDVETSPPDHPNGPRTLQERAEADERELEVRIATLVRIPPAPPGLIPKSLPQTHPITVKRERREGEQLGSPPQSEAVVATSSNGLQQALDRLNENFPERQGYSVPIAVPPPIVRHDPLTAPSVLVPLSAICVHCGSINLRVIDPITKQTNANTDRTPK
jgi:hypothetical protein